MEWLWLIGRAIFGFYFVLSGFNHFSQLQGMKQYAQWKGLPAPGLAVVGSGLFLLLGGVSLLTGLYVTWGVLLLVVFLVLAAVFMHNFWTVDDATAKQNEMIHFMKNLALAGAALMMLAIPNWSWGM